jgi:DNA-binding XRE family transcriptional regulator
MIPDARFIDPRSQKQTLFGHLIPWYLIRQNKTIKGMAKPSPLHSGDPSLVALGVGIRLRRKELGLSQESLALATDLDRSYVGGVERGEHNLSMVNLCRLSLALEMRVSELLKSCNL